MSASLIVRLRVVLPFNEVLKDAKSLLLDMLKLESVPALTSMLPPGRPAVGVHPENRLLDISFPGAYVRFEGDEQSAVSVHVFEGGSSRENLLIGYSSTGASSSDVLAAALAAASARLMGNQIILDAGTHWVEKEEYSPMELVEKLAIEKDQSDFKSAVENAYRKEAVHARI